MLFRLLLRLRTMRALLAMARRGGPILLRVIAINWLLFSAFAIIGVRLLGGKLWHCSDPSVLLRSECVGSFTDGRGVARAREWRRVFYWQNLDTFLMAMLHLFEVVSLEQWNLYMHWAQATVGVDQGIRPDASWHYAWFYHAFLYAGLYTGMAMIIGVLVFFFQRSRQSDEEEATDETGLLSKPQRECRDVVATGVSRRLRARLRPPTNPVRRYCWDIAHHAWFDPLVMAAIFANVVLLAAQRNPRPASTDAAMEKVNVFFAVLFLAEMAVKLAGLELGLASIRCDPIRSDTPRRRAGPRLYAASAWNLLDGAATLAGLLGLAVAALNSNIGPNFMRGLRLLRVIRILRLARLFKGVQLIFVTVLDCLPALGSIGLLLVLVIYIYGIIGVWQFQYVMLEGATTARSDINFQRFPRALVSLFRMTTGENWDTLMWDYMRQPESGCTPGVPYEDCGTFVAAPVFFVSFFFLTYFLGNNLFVAVVRDSFERIAARDEYLIREAELQRFAAAWERLDPRATGFISAGWGVRRLLASLGMTSRPERRRKGARPPPDRLPTAIELCRELKGVPVANARVHYADVLNALVRRVYRTRGVELPPHIRRQLERLATRRHAGLREHHAAARALRDSYLERCAAGREGEARREGTGLLHRAVAASVVQSFLWGHAMRARVVRVRAFLHVMKMRPERGMPEGQPAAVFWDEGGGRTGRAPSRDPGTSTAGAAPVPIPDPDTVVPLVSAEEEEDARGFAARLAARVAPADGDAGGDGDGAGYAPIWAIVAGLPAAVVAGEEGPRAVAARRAEQLRLQEEAAEKEKEKIKAGLSRHGSVRQESRHESRHSSNERGGDLERHGSRKVMHRLDSKHSNKEKGGESDQHDSRHGSRVMHRLDSKHSNKEKGGESDRHDSRHGSRVMHRLDSKHSNKEKGGESDQHDSRHGSMHRLDSKHSSGKERSAGAGLDRHGSRHSNAASKPAAGHEHMSSGAGGSGHGSGHAPRHESPAGSASGHGSGAERDAGRSGGRRGGRH
eukprot:tig00020904_g15280.t1